MKKATEKKTASKSQGSVKGNFPKPKAKVTIFNKGHKTIDLVLCRGNFPPAQTGDREKDLEALQQYRENYRADLKRIAREQAKGFKPKTLFDLYQIKHPNEVKHPAQLAKQVVDFCKKGVHNFWGKEVVLLTTS